MAASCSHCGSYAVTATTPAVDGQNEYRCDDCGEYFVGEIMYNFTWVNKAAVRPTDIVDWTAAALKIVAWAGQGGDWAAYSGPSDWPDQKVAEEGDKIDQKAAELLFPAFKWSGRYYRK